MGRREIRNWFPYVLNKTFMKYTLPFNLSVYVCASRHTSMCVNEGRFFFYDWKIKDLSSNKAQGLNG